MHPGERAAPGSRARMDQLAAHAQHGSDRDELPQLQDPDAEPRWPSCPPPFATTRCSTCPGATRTTTAAMEPISFAIRDYSKLKPVSDKVFAIFRNSYRYDPAPLSDTILDPIEESNEYWTKQKATFNAAYGNERMSAYVYLPKNATPPYRNGRLLSGARTQYTSGPAAILTCSAAASSLRAGAPWSTRSIRAITSAVTQ